MKPLQLKTIGQVMKALKAGFNVSVYFRNEDGNTVHLGMKKRDEKWFSILWENDDSGSEEFEHIDSYNLKAALEGLFVSENILDVLAT